MNERKYPFNKLAVRQAVNYAIDRTALVKIYGGQGTPTENIIPPGLGTAYKAHTLYPYDLAKAKQLIQQAGVAGARLTAARESVILARRRVRPIWPPWRAARVSSMR